MHADYVTDTDDDVGDGKSLEICMSKALGGRVLYDGQLFGVCGWLLQPTLTGLAPAARRKKQRRNGRTMKAAAIVYPGRLGYRECSKSNKCSTRDEG